MGAGLLDASVLLSSCKSALLGPAKRHEDIKQAVNKRKREAGWFRGLQPVARATAFCFEVISPGATSLIRAAERGWLITAMAAMHTSNNILELTILQLI